MFNYVVTKVCVYEAVWFMTGERLSPVQFSPVQTSDVIKHLTLLSESIIVQNNDFGILAFVPVVFDHELAESSTRHR